jgi:hypothetical protein
VGRERRTAEVCFCRLRTSGWKHSGTRIWAADDLHEDFRAGIVIVILQALTFAPSRVDGLELHTEKQKGRTVYKIVYSDVTEKPETRLGY